MKPIVAGGHDSSPVIGTAGDDEMVIVAGKDETVVVIPYTGNDTVRVVGPGHVVIYDWSGSGDDTYYLNGGSATVVYGLDTFGIGGQSFNLGNDHIENFTVDRDVIDFRPAIHIPFWHAAALDPQHFIVDSVVVGLDNQFELQDIQFGRDLLFFS